MRIYKYMGGGGDIWGSKYNKNININIWEYKYKYKYMRI